jgi:hypothetical protein
MYNALLMMLSGYNANGCGSRFVLCSVVFGGISSPSFQSQGKPYL